MIRTVIGSVLLGCGVLALALSVYGIYHFHYVMNRMHAAAITDAVALSLILLGLAVLAPDSSYIPKLILILLIQWIGSPIASHMVARLEIRTDTHAGEHMTVISPEDAKTADKAQNTAKEEAIPHGDLSEKACSCDKEGENK